MSHDKLKHGGKRTGSGRKPLPEHLKKIARSYRATRPVHELLEQLRQIANNATPAEHTQLSACLRAMREAQGAEAEAGKD